MTVVFDLDDTLIDTVRFKRDLEIEDADTVIPRMSDYVFPGAEAMLGRLREEGWSLVLLTYGEEVWQERKVRHTGLADRFDRLIFTHEAKVALAPELRSFARPLVMVNDNGEEIDALKEVLPEAEMVAMQGPKPLPRTEGVPVAQDMEGIYDIIRRL